ncbi:hypothetical protein A5320_01965 [Rheinheimera sp. SA_1]|jgi:flagellar assembly factor FliW|uniref:hypothetical protein n=1 Tax=Rheinheimera sp. SA_1 TaxID=1827365 RepID=UPI0007FC2827|nr:hypothetical protein [Rheinheimera sp. SA_1]OBP16207.1 hypothetical protein A5320_01965 [Rheinheimera sp. SA_1]
MKKNLMYAAAASLVFTVTGCANVDKNYAFVVDQEQLDQLENSQRKQRNVGHVVWVNPPLKKVEMAKVAAANPSSL